MNEPISAAASRALYYREVHDLYLQGRERPTEESTAELVELIKEDPDCPILRNELWLTFIPLALKLARQHSERYPDIDDDDVISEAIASTRVAADNFDPDRSVKPITYFWGVVKRRLLQRVNEFTYSVVSVPASQKESHWMLDRVFPAWEDPRLSVMDVAKKAKVSAKVVESARKASLASRNNLSRPGTAALADTLCFNRDDYEQLSVEDEALWLEMPTIVSRAHSLMEQLYGSEKAGVWFEIFRRVVDGETIVDVSNSLGMSRALGHKYYLHARAAIAWVMLIEYRRLIPAGDLASIRDHAKLCETIGDIHGRAYKNDDVRIMLKLSRRLLI